MIFQLLKSCRETAKVDRWVFRCFACRVISLLRFQKMELINTNEILARKVSRAEIMFLLLRVGRKESAQARSSPITSNGIVGWFPETETTRALNASCLGPQVLRVRRRYKFHA